MKKNVALLSLFVLFLFSCSSGPEVPPTVVEVPPTNMEVLSAVGAALDTIYGLAFVTDWVGFNKSQKVNLAYKKAACEIVETNGAYRPQQFYIIDVETNKWGKVKTDSVLEFYQKANSNPGE